MEKQNGIIYPKNSKTSIIFITSVVLVLAGIYWFGVRQKKTELIPLQPTPIQGDVSIQAGFFTVSQSHIRIAIKKGDVKPILVTIKVIPLEGFSDPVLFAVDGVLKDGEPLADSKTLKASFKPVRLESKNFEKGTVLAITPSATITTGAYFISYRARSSKIKKDFGVRVVVE